MLTLEPPPSATVTKPLVRTYRLQLRDGSNDRPSLDIPPGKHSVGSGPRCSLRLAAAGVQPVECLLVHDRNGLHARRWSETALVNGEPFDEVQLSAGDLLTLGTLTLEVVASAFPPAESADDEFAGSAADTCDPTIETARKIAVSPAPRRSGGSRQPAGVGRRQSSDSELDTSAAAPSAVDRTHELEQRAQQLESELELVRAELTASEGELAHSRYAIEVLERQLIDGQHAMHAMTEERLKWGEQFDELESRLADYVQRIQGLERQLEDVRTLRSEEAAGSAAVKAAENALVPESAVATEDFAIDESATAADVQAEEFAAGCETDWQQLVDESAVDFVGHDAETVVVAEEAETALAPDITDNPAEPPHGLSLWHQESEVVDEDSSAPEPPEPTAAADQPAKPEFAAPPSFIDRYAHLFSADESNATAPEERPRPIPAESPSAAPHHVDHDSEHAESVEQYMAKLLERMRGKPSAESAASDEPSHVETAAQAAENEVSAEGDLCEWPKDLVEDLNEIRSRPGAPELASDLEAMREVANRSTRQAIGIHTARALRRRAMKQMIIGLMGAAAAAYLLLGAPRWLSLQFAAGCITAFVAAYWGKLTLATFFEGVRVGAFDDDEDEEPRHAKQAAPPTDTEQPSVEHSPLT